MSEKLTIGSCFSGIGGLELGLEWTGRFETKWQIEIDPYASAVLAKHWPTVKRYSDIRDVVRPEPVDLICGGFPCQDVSLAGKRAGLEGKRSTLWGEMFRLICEVKPGWVVAENVPGLLSSDDGRFFGNIIRDLAFAGYDAEWGMFSARGVGAPHLRKRIFIVAYTGWFSERSAISGFNKKQIDRDETEIRSRTGNRSSDSSEEMADATGQRLQRGIATRNKIKKKEVRFLSSGCSELRNATIKRFSDRAEKKMGTQGSISKLKRSDWWTIEPNVGRVAYGIPRRVDRLKCLGNAVVPQVAQKIGEMILKWSDDHCQME